MAGATLLLFLTGVRGGPGGLHLRKEIDTYIVNVTTLENFYMET